MKKYAFIALAFALAVAGSARAQAIKTADHAGLDKILTKIFGDNNSFTADMVTTETVHDESTTIPGKIASSPGAIRTELDLGNGTSPRMKPENTARLKTMGLDQTVEIRRFDKNISYFLYPNLSAYVETPLQNADAKPDTAFKVKITELGKETIDSHPCIKNKVVVTDDQGNNYETTVWNATNLKQFPLKIEIASAARTSTYALSNVKMGKSDATLFEVPANYKKYASQQAVTFEQMKKQMGSNALHVTSAPPTNHP